mgnify:CR=1 FL=1
MESEERQDPWHNGADPRGTGMPNLPGGTTGADEREAPPPSPPAPPQLPQRSFTGVSTEGRAAIASVPHEAPPQRIIHDIPPAWSGENPAKQFEPYLKILQGWLSTTRTLKTQHGLVILQSATGDLKEIINELEIEELTSDTSGMTVLKHIQQSYFEYLEKKLPQTIEAGIYDKNVSRRRCKGMLPYCTRRDTHFKKLAKEGWEIPSLAKGYVLMRDAHLNDKARDLIEMWSEGIYEYKDMQQWLKRLERPVPGTGGQRMLGVTAYSETSLLALEAEPAEDDSYVHLVTESFVYLNESLFLLPEAFDEELLDEAAQYLDDPDYLFVAGDLSDEVELEEDEAVAILANYCLLYTSPSPRDRTRSRMPSSA